MCREKVNNLRHKKFPRGVFTYNAVKAYNLMATTNKQKSCSSFKRISKCCYCLNAASTTDEKLNLSNVFLFYLINLISICYYLYNHCI